MGEKVRKSINDVLPDRVKDYYKWHGMSDDLVEGLKSFSMNLGTRINIRREFIFSHLKQYPSP